MDIPERPQPSSDDDAAPMSPENVNIRAQSFIRSATDSHSQPVLPQSDLGVIKLQLEVAALRFKHSPAGRLLEYLPLTSQIITLVALMWTINGSLHQQESARLEVQEARRERIYTKLGSVSAAERATAIVQLASMLGKEGKGRDEEILTSLSTRVSLDENPDIRTAVVRVFDNLPASVDKTVISSTLKFVVQLQKNLRENMLLSDSDLATLVISQATAFKILGEYSLVSIKADQQEHVIRLVSLADAIIALVKSGGHLADMSGIVCMGCDFSRTGADLSKVDFRGSLLAGSTWLNMKLNDSNFEETDLAKATFDGADMRRARLSMNPGLLAGEVTAEDLKQSPVSRSPVETAENLLPTFRCADLRDAQIDEMIVGVAADDLKKNNYNLISGFVGANIAGVDFDRANLFVVSREKAIPNPYTTAGDFWVLEKAPAIFVGKTTPLVFAHRYWTSGSYDKRQFASFGVMVTSILQSAKNFNQIQMFHLTEMPHAPIRWETDCAAVAAATSKTYRWSVKLRN